MNADRYAILETVHHASRKLMFPAVVDELHFRGSASSVILSSPSALEFVTQISIVEDTNVVSVAALENAKLLSVLPLARSLDLFILSMSQKSRQNIYVHASVAVL
jgi:hypothetical protein